MAYAVGKEQSVDGPTRQLYMQKRKHFTTSDKHPFHMIGPYDLLRTTTIYLDTFLSMVLVKLACKT